MTRDVIRGNGGITSRPPFGYSVEGPRHGKYFVIAESLEETVKTIFSKCIAGDSLVTIAKWLDAQGIPTARGGKWSASALKNVINNTAYMGYITDDNGRVIGECPAIIDAATHKAANHALKNRPARGPVLAENRALCSGVLYCPECLVSPMYRIKAGKNQGGQGYYYRCAGRGAQRKGCGNMVRLELVDAKIDEMMRSNRQPIMRREYVPGHNHTAEVADVNFRIKQLDPESMNDDEYDAALKALRAERDSYQAMPAVPDSWKQVDTGETYASKWAASDLDGKRNMLKNIKVLAGKNQDGEVVVFIRERDDDGQLSAQWL
jgi:hypothetical protein